MTPDDVLEFAGGSIEKAAEIAGIDRRSLWRLRKKGKPFTPVRQKAIELDTKGALLADAYLNNANEEIKKNDG